MTEPLSGQWRNIVPTLSFYNLDQFAALLRNVSRKVCPHHLFEPRNLVQDEIGRSAEPTQIGHEALNVTLGHSLKLGLVLSMTVVNSLIIGALRSGCDGARRLCHHSLA